MLFACFFPCGTRAVREGEPAGQPRLGRSLALPSRADATLLFLPLLVCSMGAAPATQPQSRPADSALWSRLNQIDARAGRIHSLAANFEQEKFTPLLKKPLISTGRVRISGSTMRWDTQSPQPSVLLIDPHEARVYYPAQKAMEIYALDQRVGELAASPLPRLSVLRQRFSFEQVPATMLDKSADPSRFVALRLTPISESLRQHVREVLVLLDSAAAYIVKAEMIDSDGERTVLSFKQVQVNVDVGPLALSVPPGTAVSHPLEGLDGSQPQGNSR